MNNVKGGTKNGLPQQMSLWDQVIMDPIPQLKIAMAEAMKGSALSREQIVDRMNEVMKASGWTTNGRGQQVTASLLDKWVAPSASHIIPLRLLPLFCRVIGSNLPLEIYTRSFDGARVISIEDEKLLMWAKSEAELRVAKKRARRMAQEVGIE